MTTRGGIPNGDRAAEQDVTGPVIQTLAELSDTVLAAVKSYLRPHLKQLERRILRRVVGYVLALLAAIWAAIAATFAAAQHMPLWASFLCVSALLAVGATCAFIIPSGENGKRTAGGQTLSEGE